MPLSKNLTGLTPREAITDAIHRCIDGFDHNDPALFDSSCTSDAVFNLNGNRLEGLEAIHKNVFDYIASLDTTHFLSNIRIEVHPSGTEASVSAHALAQHFRTGEGSKPGSERLLAGSLYEIELVRDETDGLWRWKYWDLKIVWGEGNMDIVTTEAQAFNAARA